MVSPDGKLIAFTTTTGSEGNLEIWFRPINSQEAHHIAGTFYATFPFWSPDSRSLGFFADGKLKKVDVNTGSPIELADAPTGRGGAWGPGGTIVFSLGPSEALMPQCPSSLTVNMNVDNTNYMG